VEEEPTAAVGLRERKKLQTREALEGAALDLFDRQGFERTTVEEIADACDVSPRTFFRYFANKEAVLFLDADEKRAELVARLMARPAGEPPLQSIRAGVSDTVAALELDRERVRMRSRIMAASPTLQNHRIQIEQSWDDALLDALLARRTRSAGGPTRFELRLVASTATAALRAALASWLDEGGSLVKRVDAAFAAVSHGLGEIGTASSS
jgi:AcrR family transcriptional regulator